MALLSRLFQNRKNTRDSCCKCPPFENSKGWSPPEFDKNEIRLVLFRDHYVRGRVPLFDSKAFPVNQGDKKSCPSQAAKQSSEKSPKAQHVQCATPKPSGRTGSDMKMLEEMMFGSVAVIHKGSTLKVHEIRNPPQLMVSKVFLQKRPSRESIGDSENFDSCSLQGEIGDYSTPRNISGSDKSRPNLATSVPVDVPMPAKSHSYKDEDSGVCASTTSSCSSLTTPLPSPSSSSSMNSDSFKSLQRRFLRNQTTSLELHFRKKISDEVSMNMNGGEPYQSSKKSAKLGIGLIFNLNNNRTEEANMHFQNFFFSHITLIEGHVNKLRVGIERILLNRKWCSQKIIEELDIFRTAIYDLYATPRLSEPVWLNMMSLSTRRVALCHQFLKEFTQAVNKLDTKNTNFFLSTLITAVLTHHLAWVPTVTPAGATPSRTYLDKHSAKWLDTLARSHPYNPLWAQLGDLYGAIGFPLRLSRTLIVGKKTDIVTRLLYILSYFIRCSEVHENVDELLDCDFDEELFSDIVVEDPGGDTIHLGEMTPIKEDSMSFASRKNSGQDLAEMASGSLASEVISTTASSVSSLEGSNNSVITVNTSPIGLKLAKGSAVEMSVLAEKVPSPDQVKPNANRTQRNNYTFKCLSNKTGVINNVNGDCKANGTIDNTSLESLTGTADSMCAQDTNKIQLDSENHFEAGDMKCSNGSAQDGVFGAGDDSTSVPLYCETNPSNICDKQFANKINSTEESSHLNCHLSPVEIRDAKVLRVRHVGRQIPDDKYENVESHTPAIDNKLVDNLPSEDGIPTREKEQSHDSGIFDGSSVDLGQSKKSNSVRDMGNSVFYLNADHTQDIGESIFYDTECQCRFSDLVSENGDTRTSDYCEGEKLPFQTGSTHNNGLYDVRKHNKGVQRMFSNGSTNSMFDEYFDDDAHIEKTCSNIPKPPLLLRLTSKDSLSMFDEYFSEESHNGNVKPLLKDDSVKNHNKDHSTPKGLINLSSETDSLENSIESNVTDSTEMRVRSDSQGSRRVRRLSGKQNNDRSLSRQNSSQSAGTPARTRCVTPTELGRRRHMSSTSITSDLDSFDPFLNLKEIPIVGFEDEEEENYSVQGFDRNFGRSLMAGYSDHYLSDFALHGTADKQFSEKLHRDLSMSVQHSVLDEPITESVCVLADIDKWSVQLVSAQYASPEKPKYKDVIPSQMIANMIESVQDLWKLKMSPEFCLMHLEDRLQEIYFKSKMVAEYLKHDKLNRQQLVEKLRVDESDLPLLLAVAGTQSTQLALGLMA